MYNNHDIKWMTWKIIPIKINPPNLNNSPICKFTNQLKKKKRHITKITSI